MMNTAKQEDRITVRVGRAPGGRFQEVSLNGSRSVGDALRLAEIIVQQHEEIRVDSEPVGEGTVMRDGQTCTVTRKMKGNIAIE